MRAEADSRSLYDLLELQVVPAYYEGRDHDDVPQAWVTVMKEAITTIGPRFSTRRMVKEYTDRFYIPATRQGAALMAERFQLARDLAGWKAWIYTHWNELDVQAQGPTEGRLALGQSAEVTASVGFGSLSPRDVIVELVCGLVTTMDA